jgi:hypothetical protein
MGGTRALRATVGSGKAKEADLLRAAHRTAAEWRSGYGLVKTGFYPVAEPAGAGGGAGPPEIGPPLAPLAVL